MYKSKLWMPVLIGLIAGQLFAEGERPLKVVNTVRVGYSDNIDRVEDGKSGAFLTDIIDLSFRAVLSDRTDVTVKSQLNVLTDTGHNRMQPNLYVMMNHSVSPRLLFGLSEYYRSSEKSQGEANISGKKKYYNFFNNTVGATADYVLTEKDRLNGSVNYSVLQSDKAISSNDYTTVGSGISWKRELSPQRTFMTLNLRQSHLNYDNQSKDTLYGIYQDTNSVNHEVGRDYYNDNAFYDKTDLSVGLSHTFNQSWSGNLEVGVSYVRNNFSGSREIDVTTNSITVLSTTNGNDNATLTPLLNAGVVYSPSSRTRLTGDLSLSYQPSDNDGYGGQNTTELRFGAQHDLTAKLMAKATARFASVKYDEKNNTGSSTKRGTEDRMDLDFRLTYKLNRIHFLEAGVQHRETNRDTGSSWSENRVDVGWRVELN